MIPSAITRHHLETAILRLSKSRWPLRRESTKYDLIWKTHRVPPKEAVRDAAKIAGVAIGDFGGGNETNSFLWNRGFVVVDKDQSLLAAAPAEEDEERSFIEGAESFRVHRHRERSGAAPIEAKRRRLASTGDLACDACGFSFVQVYGERGAGFIEAHHDQPLSQAGGIVETKVEDLALLCSNCHRILHRVRPWLRVSELREQLNSRT